MISYGDGKESPQNFYYKFEEIIDFSKYKFVCSQLKNKKYFLSSLIVCKYPKDKEKELFYTFCRKDTKSPFFVYNSLDVRDNIKNVKNKIIKQKDEELKHDRSFPYALIYSEF